MNAPRFCAWHPDGLKATCPYCFGALEAEVAELRDALREAEWNGSAWIGMATCPVCGFGRAKGHASDCSVGAALAGSDPPPKLSADLLGTGGEFVERAAFALLSDPPKDREGQDGQERAVSRLAEATSEIGTDATPPTPPDVVSPQPGDASGEGESAPVVPRADSFVQAPGVSLPPEPPQEDS